RARYGKCQHIRIIGLVLIEWICLVCRKHQGVPNVPDSIEELTRIVEIPPWIENLSRLRKIIMNGCEELKKISRNVSKLENLEFLGLRKSGKSEHDYVSENEYEYNRDLFEAVIEWEGPDSECSWRLVSDLDVHYILLQCLPTKKALSLCLRGLMNTIPDCIRRLSGLTKLDVTGCPYLKALPPLPDSLLSIDADCCSESKRKRAHLHIRLQTCTLTGEEVPAHFPHQATPGSLTINLMPRPLPSSLRFKACILLSKKIKKEELLMGGVSCHVMGKQNGLTIQYVSKQYHMHCRYGGYRDLYNYSKKKEDHLYIFEDYFCLNQDYPKAGEATLSELVFEPWYKLEGERLRCTTFGEDEEESGRDEDEDDEAGDGDSNEVEEDIKDDVDKTLEGEESRRDDDAETRSKKRMSTSARAESSEFGDAIWPTDELKKASENTTWRGGGSIACVGNGFTWSVGFTSDSLTINQAPQPLPTSLRFKSCILLSRGIINLEDDKYGVSWRINDLYDGADEKLVMRVSCTFRVNRKASLSDMYHTSVTTCLIFMDVTTVCIHLKIALEPKKPLSASLCLSSKFFIKIGSLWCTNLEDKEESGRDEEENDEAGDADNDGVEEEIKDGVDKTQEGDESRCDDDAETRSKNE
ncbi:LOW QUALITY PROTEIN: hypothetical protein HID58_095409, partial [Brassica napus]